MNRAALAFILYQKKILLLHRDNVPTIPNPDKWGAIGGIVEEGETYDKGIRREIKEETNLEPRNIKRLGRLPSPNWVEQTYLVWLDDDEVEKVQLGNEGQELRFFSLEELFTIPLPEMLEFHLKKYHDAIQRLFEGENVLPAELGLE
jgi:ADP-ribose pyrophosphatase YjhB (NUDIX family)